MNNQITAPKQWCLTKEETLSSFESWKNNFLFILNREPNFAPFLLKDTTWLKHSKTVPLRGFQDDGADVPQNSRQTAQQKLNFLDLMLGMIANFCPVISRSTIIKKSTSITHVWQLIRIHYGFQTSGSHILDFTTIKRCPEEKPEDLYQRLASFIDDNLVTTESRITHHGEEPTEDEELTPTLENLVVLRWLELLHKNLPQIVKQKYGTDLRSCTLSSIKQEISQALDSLLEEAETLDDVKVMRSKSFYPNRQVSQPRHTSRPTCPLCVACKRKQIFHFLSRCPFLPKEDKEYMQKASTSKMVTAVDDREDENTHTEENSSNVEYAEASCGNTLLHRVDIKRSPYIYMYCDSKPVYLLLDTGAEANLIHEKVVKRLGLDMRSTSHTGTATCADGSTQLQILGEIECNLSVDKHNFKLHALVVKQLSSDILAGTPFMMLNDIWARPAKQEIHLSDDTIFTYSTKPGEKPYILRASSKTVIWPGQFYEVPFPVEMSTNLTIALEPRQNKSKVAPSWPSPNIYIPEDDKIRIFNHTTEPQVLHKHDQFAQIMQTQDIDISSVTNSKIHGFCETLPVDFTNNINVDPDKILPNDIVKQFHEMHSHYNSVFSPDTGCYNGASGHFEAVVNMGLSEPPQHKGRIPQYSRNRLVELQEKFDQLEHAGILKTPEEADIYVEYVNPSFLVKKSGGGTRLVTAFTEVGKYTKPTPSLMPDVNSVLRKIACWYFIIKTDLSAAYYQIPLAKRSMKYCGVVTPFRGTRVYTRCAMGMPGSEVALEEMTCRVLDELLKSGIVIKLADDLYCGGNSPNELIQNWQLVLEALHSNGLHLSPSKTFISPKTTTLLGWQWTQGKLQACSHRISTLSTCEQPKTVKGLRSFIGAYKILSRVLQGCSQFLAALEDCVAGKSSSSPIVWTDNSTEAFSQAQKFLLKSKCITLPRSEDQLWIVTDGASKTHGLGATLYIMRKGQLHLSGFFIAKLRKQQKTWIPCEIEALSIASALKHFSPFIIQSSERTILLTDSKPCVQAFDKLSRGQFSTSPRVYSFLATASQYEVTIQHLAGSSNLPSDFASRNAEQCHLPNCQICKFISDLEESPIIRTFTVNDILNGNSKLPFTNRKAWIPMQQSCGALRRTHAHLTQGTRPSKKCTNVRDIKRYLQRVVIASDGLLVVRNKIPFSQSQEKIVIPRSMVNGILTAIHLQLNHPSKHQMKQLVQRYFFFLDMEETVNKSFEKCHQCMSLLTVPKTAIPQTTGKLPSTFGENFAADVIKRNQQLVLVLREVISSYTVAMFISDEKSSTLRSALLSLCLPLRTLETQSIIRTDGAPGFIALKTDSLLNKHNIAIEIGDAKNPNKNPVAEKAIREIIDEMLRQQPGGGAITPLTLALVIERLNTRIRSNGLSAREVWTQRDQYSNSQLQFQDLALASQRFESRNRNHPHSEKSKAPRGKQRNPCSISVGQLVYLYSDQSKLKSRQRYMVLKIENEWCEVVKLTGNNLRKTYRVRISDCYSVESEVPMSLDSHQLESSSDEEITLPAEIADPPTTQTANYSENQPHIDQRPRRTIRRPARFNDYILDSDLST